MEQRRLLHSKVCSVEEDEDNVMVQAHVYAHVHTHAHTHITDILQYTHSSTHMYTCSWYYIGHRPENCCPPGSLENIIILLLSA